MSHAVQARNAAEVLQSGCTMCSLLHTPYFVEVCTIVFAPQHAVVLLIDLQETRDRSSNPN